MLHHTPSTIVGVDLDSPEAILEACFVERSGSLSDIAGHWAYNHILDAYHLSVVDGYSGRVFRPNSAINRAEFVKIVARALCLEAPSSLSVRPFPDVDTRVWFARYVYVNKLRGFVDGYADGLFRPANDLTRAEAIKVLTLAAGESIPNYKTTLFVDGNGHWAVKYLETARRKGYLRGYPDGSARPDASITRAEVMSLVNKILLKKDAWEKYAAE